MSARPKNGCESCTRREAVALGSGIAASSFLGSLLGASKARSAAASQRRLFQLVLTGGWDSHFATDPVVGSKIVSGAYQPDYQALATASPPGKPKIVFGQAFASLAPVLADVPVAVVNGIHVEVPAHDLANDHNLTGRLSLSRTREYPSVVALLGKATNAFPSHVVLGEGIPLGDTRMTAPPLATGDFGTFTRMLTGPRYDDPERGWRIGAANRLIEGLNAVRYRTISDAARARLEPWENAQKQLDALYAARYPERFPSRDALKASFGMDGDWGHEAMMAAGFCAMQSNLARFVTLRVGNFDSHGNHMMNHLPLLTKMGTLLTQLVTALKTTDDPAAAGTKMIETTTIFVTSEFVRTPLFNLGQGTDHWNSASALFIGAGVNDGVAIAGTDDHANPLGWELGAAVPLTEQNRVLPDHVAAGIARNFGAEDIVELLGGKVADGLFV